jgi:hypothetical protein
LFAGFDFQSLGRRKFPFSVGLAARGAAVQFTNFPDSRATGGAGHRQYLFFGKILGLHNRMMQR